MKTFIVIFPADEISEDQPIRLKIMDALVRCRFQEFLPSCFCKHVETGGIHDMSIDLQKRLPDGTAFLMAEVQAVEVGAYGRHGAHLRALKAQSDPHKP